MLGYQTERRERRLQKLILSLIAVVVAFPAQSDLSSLQHRYFLVVWGYQGAGNLPRDSHTFLTVYRGDDLVEGAGGTGDD